MTASAHPVEVLIAEADPWTSNLLQQLVLDVRGDARVLQVSDGQTALARCKRRLPDLVIADGELPGLDGVELLRQLRRHPRTPALPFVLISGRLDASSVRAARPLAPSAYLAKPFNAESLRQRLRGLLPVASGEPQSRQPLLLSELRDFLDTVREEGQGAPLLSDVRNAVSQGLQAGEQDLGELAAVFGADPQITALLIAAASTAAQHQGMPCHTLAQALQRLGVARTLNLVLGLALQRNAQLRDARLAELAAQTWQRARRSAELARWLATELKLDAELCYTAGLLHNLGELALLRSLQDWQEAGGELSNAQIDDAMQRRAASFGSALRIRWRLPFGLRELIAAFYGLGSGVFSREALVLNLSGLLLALPANALPASLAEARCVRMLRLNVALLEQVPVELYQAS
ncbi:Sporulation initiation phosphotransferase F [Pseudomonas sp. THAF187a]|uniref:HDOD domain-containing protein n=1 Tax=unclassified Pseudomonas TaxID=196821 RepID=UPI0012695F7C|nr:MULTISPECIES: HDOD domain-containing protein [unclassified Pseudomonas]QFT24501.1 Sporulation initiation phosphotransferase F [Pseudomonas sp. THAF187a]QFT44688.1 Sporulation initiation phosphotransferase F [Pseudomonas sp. THAF42]WFC64605.1 response regulator [Pseudomonas sp. REST10]